MGFPGSRVVKNPPASALDAGDVGLILGLGRSSGKGKGSLELSPGEGNGTPLHYSCLENPMGGGA